VARPLRFRYAPGSWSVDRVRSEVYGPLNANLGARMGQPWYAPPEGVEARRFDIDNGDTALICWDEEAAYWLGNTETPSSLWRTDKVALAEAPSEMTEWAEQEFLAELLEAEPWLAPYPTLASFFLPVLCSKDGADSTRTFLRDHACGFPDADLDDALTFYDATLARGIFDADRETMAAKLGTSKQVDCGRMAATMGEFDAARLLDDAGHGFTPEAAVDGGYSLDYRTDAGRLVEVTRPLPAARRAAGPIAGLRETANAKVDGQLAGRAGEAVLFVDCTSFPDDDWARVAGERPEPTHRPAVVYRYRPSGLVAGYTVGDPGLGVAGLVN
jgi:hypothetical protein